MHVVVAKRSKMFKHICCCEVVILLLSVRFHSVSCDVFHIVTTANSHCPGEFVGVPCLTLQQYASNPSRSQNITLLLQPGTYNLSTELTVSNGYNFTMSSNNTIVNCTSSTARFLFDSVENIYISGMTFQMCRNSAIKMTSVTQAYITNSSFIGNIQQSNYGYGGAIYAQSSNITIDQSTFSGNRGGSRGYGGAIYASSSNITTYHSNFSGNRGGFRGYGGAIYARYSGTFITIDKTTFSDNRANEYYVSSYGYGGAIYAPSSIITVNMSAFDHNDAGSYYRSTLGGAIYGGTVTVDRSAFSHNTAVAHDRLSTGFGGAIYGTTVTVERSVFSSNTARNSGGAIYCNYGNLQMSSTTVNNNRVPSGNGGVITVINGNASVSNSHFINNTAGGDGGAIYTLRDYHYYYYYYHHSVVSCQFVNNTANSFGGAVYVAGTNSSVSVTDSTFISNSAITEGGGAIYYNGRYTNVTLSSSTFNYNSASYCSVLDVDDFDHFSVNLTNSVFTYNTATGQTIGGGVACIRNASINIFNSVFEHNFANYHAGVFYIDESVTTVDGSIFINNSAVLDGGVFYTYIHASDYIISRSQFSDNAAGDDGGVMLIGRLNCFVSIDESIFDFNSAADRGGIIALVASSMYMEINRTNIFNNTAQFGEVISACNSQVIILEDLLTATVDPLLPFCTLYGGDIREFDIRIPDLDIVVTTASPTTTELFTKTKAPTTAIAPTTEKISHITTEPFTTTFPFTIAEVPTTKSPSTTADTLTTTEAPTTTFSSTTADTLTTTEAPTTTTTDTLITMETYTTIKPPDMIPTPPSYTTQSSVTMALNTMIATPPATSVIDTSALPTMDATSPNSNPTTNFEQTSTSSLLDKDINQYRTREQSTTAEHTQDDENLVTVMVVFTDSRVTTTYTISMTSLMVSLTATTLIIILIIILVSRLRPCLRKNEWNKSKTSLSKTSKTDEFTMADQSCSLTTYTSPVFDPHDDDTEKLVKDQKE